jgi:hypothetical protein
MPQQPYALKPLTILTECSHCRPYQCFAMLQASFNISLLTKAAFHVKHWRNVLLSLP